MAAGALAVAMICLDMNEAPVIGGYNPEFTGE